MKNECLDVKWILSLQQYFQAQDFRIQLGWNNQIIYYFQSPYQISTNKNLTGEYSLLSKYSKIALKIDLSKYKMQDSKVQFWKFFTKNNFDWLESNNFQCLSKIFYLQQPIYQFGYDNYFRQNAVNEFWGIRNFKLFYGILQECSYSIIQAFIFPLFIRTMHIQTSLHAFDHPLQNKLIITELGISVNPDYDDTITVGSSIKNWQSQSFGNVFPYLNLSLQNYKAQTQINKTWTAICKKNDPIKQILGGFGKNNKIRILAYKLLQHRLRQVKQQYKTQTIKQYKIKIN
ncbi:unnamed protein product [Paramecium octaurelia]|uniref:Uncharacterized protein n=1 Tax=Paramecium octaurelia TaxID=43137 RepID=A0A8S1W4S7_PAROT|nr:unnamed protein product [Paramecium octaurelia]